MKRVLWRASLRHFAIHPWQVGLSILGIALSIAVVIAVDLANESVRRAFAGFVRAVSGAATHRVVGGPSGLPEEVYVNLRRSGLRGLAPVVARDVAAVEPRGGALHLFGVDPFVEAAFRPFAAVEAAPSRERETRQGALLARPATALLERGTAARLGLRPGDVFQVRAGTRRHTLELVGVLAADDALAARTLESVLITDIATAQEVTGMVGHLTSIDLIVPPGAAGEAFLARVRAALPPAAEIVPASAGARALADLSRGFSVNLTALSLLALFVGIFLIYNTMSFSVVQRRPVIGTLRALGVTRGEIATLILTEALVLGAVATALGLPGGIVLADGLLRMVTRTVNDLYVVVAVSELAIAPATLLGGAALGVGGTLVAALAPALEATRSTPRAALARSTLEITTRALLPRLALGGVLVILAGVLGLTLSGRSLLAGYVGLCAILVGAALATPWATLLIARVAHPVAGAVFGPLGRLAVRGVSGAPSRTAVAMAALMVAVAASVGVGVMIDSFRQSVARWLEMSLQADVYVAAPSLTPSRTDGTLDPDLVARLGAAPGVAGVGSQRTVRVQSPSGEITLMAFSLGGAGYRFFSLKRGDPATVWGRLQREDAVLVSEPFAYHRGLGMGDRLRLRGDAGERDYTIAGIVYDYASSEGLVMMSRAVYERGWHDRGLSALAVYAADPAGVDALVETLRRAAGEETDVLIRSNRAIREASLEVFDRTFAVTEVLRLLALLVAFVGILSALMAQELERAREIAVLRTQGLTPAQVWGLVAAQSGFMGLVAGLLSLPVGVALALALIFGINLRSFGWTLQLEITPVILLQALLLALGTALLAAVYPAWRTSTMALPPALRHE